MRVDLSTAELHNLVRRRDGLATRPGLVSLRTPTAGHKYVAGFSLESPFTSEVWHYVVEQHTTTGLAYIRVLTEEMYELYTYLLGVLPQDPVVSYAVVNHQLMINSPSFSAPVYGLLGGGLVTAVKTPSINPDTTALEIPVGHIATFGDRFAIANANIVYFSDPGIDPRTFVAQNAVPLSGTVYDLFQAADGALYIFTSAGTYYLPQDALGRGQEVQGFLGMLPGVQTSRPRNAAASSGVVAVLQGQGIALLGGEGQQVLDVSPYKGPRYYSESIAVDDYRRSASIYATDEGLLVGFRGRRGFILEFNLKDGYRSYTWHQEADLHLVGTLRSREGETLYLLEDRIVAKVGNQDFDDATVRGVACLEVDVAEGTEVLVRRVTTSSDNIGQDVGIYTRGQASSPKATPVKKDDLVIGTSTWSAASPYRGRQPRTVRHSLKARATHLPLEVVVDGGDRRLEASIEVQAAGQGRTRSDRR